MHATCVTATTWMLSRATNTTMSHRHAASHRSCLFQPCDLLNKLSFEFPTISSKDRFNNKLSIPNLFIVNALFSLCAILGSTSLTLECRQPIFAALPETAARPLLGFQTDWLTRLSNRISQKIVVLIIVK
jgi:hypothetical protein